jgi:hypothetical protein
MKILLIILTFGCAKHHFAGKHFESSNSLCMDALIVNMEADGCKNIAVEEDEANKILKIYCSDDQVDGNSPWLNHYFYFANTQTIDIIALPGMPMCVDPSLSMSYQHFTPAK